MLLPRRPQPQNLPPSAKFSSASASAWRSRQRNLAARAMRQTLPSGPSSSTQQWVRLGFLVFFAMCLGGLVVLQAQVVFMGKGSSGGHGRGGGGGGSASVRFSGAQVAGVDSTVNTGMALRNGVSNAVETGAVRRGERVADVRAADEGRRRNPEMERGQQRGNGKGVPDLTQRQAQSPGQREPDRLAERRKDVRQPQKEMHRKDKERTGDEKGTRDGRGQRTTEVSRTERGNASAPLRIELRRGETKQNVCSPGPVVLFTMQRDEEALLEPWLRYHSWLFGPENLHVLDDCSQKRSVLGVLDRYQELGVQVLRLGNCAVRRRGMWESNWMPVKAEVLSQIMREQRKPCEASEIDGAGLRGGGRGGGSSSSSTTSGVAQPRKGSNRLFWPLEPDEFTVFSPAPLVREAVDDLSIDPTKIRAELERLSQHIDAKGIRDPTARRFKMRHRAVAGCCPASLDDYLQSDRMGPRQCEGEDAPLTRNFALASNVFSPSTLTVHGKTIFTANTFKATDAQNLWGSVNGDTKETSQLGYRFKETTSRTDLVTLQFGRPSFDLWLENVIPRAAAANVIGETICSPRNPGYFACKTLQQYMTWQQGGGAGNDERTSLQALFGLFMHERCEHIISEASDRLGDAEAVLKLTEDHKNALNALIENDKHIRYARRLTHWTDLAQWLKSAEGRRGGREGDGGGNDVQRRGGGH